MTHEFTYEELWPMAKRHLRAQLDEAFPSHTPAPTREERKLFYMATVLLVGTSILGILAAVFVLTK